MSFHISVPSRQTIALVAVLAPAAYLLILRTSVMLNIDTYSSGKRGREKHSKKRSASFPIPKGPAPSLPRALPPSVAAGDSYVLSHERLVSKPIVLSELGWRKDQLDELFTRYIRATMVAFTWTPQAYLLRKMVPSTARETFGAEYVNAMSFRKIGERVDGMYTVAYRNPGAAGGHATGERAELRLDAPEGYTGPKGEGIIAAAIELVEDSDQKVVFVNETWLWRGVNEKPTLLEGTVGRWFHSLLAAWLIGKGISAVKTGPVS